MSSVLYTIYKEKAVPALTTRFSYRNRMEVPKISKVVLNVGYGRHVKETALIDQIEKTLRTITGQQPVKTKARKSISNFKTREGMAIGMMVTLRGPQMYEFLYRLIHLVFPRVRDFRGITVKSFDGRGNYALGFKESIAFPEVSSDVMEKQHGLQIIISTTARTNEEGIALLSALGFPFADLPKEKTA